MRVRSEIVHLFYDGDTPVGMLLMNGESHFFRVSRASKEHVSELLGSDKHETDATT